jgi:hypothetical protein
MEVSGQLHAPAALSPGKEPQVQIWMGGWVGHRAGLDFLIWFLYIWQQTTSTNELLISLFFHIPKQIQRNF